MLQMGLRFGGNDVGSVMLEENVVKAAGTSNDNHRKVPVKDGVDPQHVALCRFHGPFRYHRAVKDA